MSDVVDVPLHMHPSFSRLLDSFRSMIASLVWLKVSSTNAQSFFAEYPYLIELSCTLPDQLIKVDKSILTHIQNEGFNQPTPLFSETMIDYYRVVTIAIKDIIWGEPDFKDLLQTDTFQFFRHIRNASAHQNRLYFGIGRERDATLKKFPISWRSKVIDESLEGSQLYMSFLSPGDLFVLLNDISIMATKPAA